MRILNLETRQLSTLPGSGGNLGARWSPDGRYVAAIGVSGLNVVLFDFQTSKWTELVNARVSFLNWSSDGKYVYFVRWADKAAVLRVRIADRLIEQVADLSNFRIAGNLGPWLGLTPDNAPMLLRNVGSQDIYALDWMTP